MALTADKLRRYIQDKVDVNMPLFEQYLTDDDLNECIDLALEDFNMSIPLLRAHIFTRETFPSDKLLLTGAFVEAMSMTSMKELRGEMQYSDGGVQSTIYTHYPQYQQLRQEYANRWDSDKLRFKKQLNIEGCYGGMW